MGIFGRNILGDDADHHDVMEAGYAAIAGGDGEIAKVLDMVCAIQPGRAGAITAYGGLHAFATNIRESTTRERLLEITASHASTRRSTTTGLR